MIVDYLFVRRSEVGDLVRLTPNDRVCVMVGPSGDLQPYTLLRFYLKLSK